MGINRFAQSIITSLFHASLPVSFIASIWAYLSLRAMAWSQIYPCIGFLFCNTFLVYNLDKFKDANNLDKLNLPQRSHFFRKYKAPLFILCILCFLCELYFLSFFSGATWKFLFLLGLVSFIYFFGLNKIRKFSLVKSLAKPALLGTIWAASVILLPLVYSQQVIQSRDWLQFTTLSVLFFINGNLFDYRDKVGDKIHGKANLTIYLSDRSLQILLLFLSLLALLLSLIAEQFISLTWISLYLLLFNLAVFIYPKLRNNHQELFYDYYIDSPFLLFPILEVCLQ